MLFELSLISLDTFYDPPPPPQAATAKANGEITNGLFCPILLTALFIKSPSTDFITEEKRLRCKVIFYNPLINIILLSTNYNDQKQCICPILDLYTLYYFPRSLVERKVN